MARRNGSSSRWLSEHFKDQFVRKAQQQGFRSRALFKLSEINARDRLFNPGMTVLDLGSSPGGWSQLAAGIVGKIGRVIALDVLPMENIQGVTFILGDFRDEIVLQKLAEAIGEDKIELVLSDMAPNISGTRAVDQAQAMHLAELALEIAKTHLKPGGTFLVKLFQGTGFKEFHETAQSVFEKTAVRKPKASRPRSREIYLLARGFK